MISVHASLWPSYELSKSSKIDETDEGQLTLDNGHQISLTNHSLNRKAQGETIDRRNQSRHLAHNHGSDAS